MNAVYNNQYDDYIEKTLTALSALRPGMAPEMPSKKLARQFTDLCFQVLFPQNAHKNANSSEEVANLYKIENLLTHLLLPLRNELGESIENIRRRFISGLPALYVALIKDAEAIREFDPAARNLEEVLLAYPGFFAIMAHRISHELFRMKIPVVPRLISEYAHSETGIDIHPGAQIGESFFIDHGTGVVIGETCVIKNNVKIYQGVTLGALQVKKSLASTIRHPTVEDNVIIYAHATILGGNTVIGADSVIGGNVWITASVPPNSLVYHKDEIRIKPQHFDFTAIDFQI